MTTSFVMIVLIGLMPFNNRLALLVQNVSLFFCLRAGPGRNDVGPGWAGPRNFVPFRALVQTSRRDENNTPKHETRRAPRSRRDRDVEDSACPRQRPRRNVIVRPTPRSMSRSRPQSLCLDSCLVFYDLLVN